ncbi:MAG: hypothetical protein ACM3OO_11815 [Planctomycetaceae bacterium]
MSTDAAGQPVPARPDRGHQLAVWSLAMIAFLVISAAVGGIVGWVLLSSQGLEGSEPMSEQGTIGWVAFGLSTAIFMAPMVVGVVLGAKARKLGERRLGTIGMVVDGVILLGYPAVAIANTIA